MENYKKTYEKYCNIKTPRGYEIHHIDLNRQNNSIENLVMLSRKLHQRYHLLLNSLPSNLVINKKISSIIEGGQGTNQFLLDVIKEFVDVKNECDKWCDYKNYLLGLLPNIHNIEVENGDI